MEFKIHDIHGTKIAELVSGTMLVNNAQDGLDLLGNAYYQHAEKVIIRQQNISPAFFDLKTGMAGEILQKFSTYRVKLAIVGDFSAYESKSLRDFIFESNKQGHIHFVASMQEAFDRLAQHA